MLPLPDLQRAFLLRIARSHDVAEDELAASPLAGEIEGNDRLGPAARLAIYARMYCARLVDVLREDYPRVAAVLGTDAFADVAHDYVAAHPSTDPSLRWFGRGFAEFLAHGAAGPPLFVPDLARLEWARRTVFDAADSALLDGEALRRILPERWPCLRLRLVPAFEVLSVGWPVHRIWSADEPATPPESWRREDSWLRVWRQGDRVFQAPMDGAERRAVQCVQEGRNFGEMCEALATVLPAEDVAPTAGALVLRWIADGLLRADAILP